MLARHVSAGSATNLDHAPMRRDCHKPANLASFSSHSGTASHLRGQMSLPRLKTCVIILGGGLKGIEYGRDD
jgi:hypothetical protein